MSGFISQNFMKTTSPLNSFLLETQGYYAGIMLDDPSAQQWIVTGMIGNSVMQAMWAGLPITETNPGLETGANIGGSVVSPATSNSAITGFMIANQEYNGVISNSNNVPMFSSGMSISFVRLRSNARVVVPVDPGTAPALVGLPINSQISWDFTNNALTTYNSTTGALPALLLELNSNSRIPILSNGYATWGDGTVAVIQI